jgi:hypothetical protein
VQTSVAHPGPGQSAEEAEAVWVAGDLIDDEAARVTVEKAEGYNGRMLTEIRAQFGEVDLRDLWEEADS